jgi:CheY-like chemotaxis protein
VATAWITGVARPDVAHRAKILLVDDRAENLLALEAILSSLDQDLVAVRSGEAAVAAAEGGEFAVILLDVLMPGMDGFETAGRIKERGRTPDVPIIFLTAAGAEPEFAFRGYAAGAVDYISKPFDPWVLRAKVSVFVDLYLKDQRLRMLSGLLPRLAAVEEAAAELSALPEARAAEDSGASGASAADALAAGLARLDGSIALLRESLDGLGLREERP